MSEAMHGERMRRLPLHSHNIVIRESGRSVFREAINHRYVTNNRVLRAFASRETALITR
jgi:hypothetical protein